MPKKGNAQQPKQYRLPEAWRKKREASDAIVAPDQKDRKVTHQQLYDFVTAKSAAGYTLRVFRERLNAALGQLPDEALGKLYDRIKKPEAPKKPDAAGKDDAMTRENFIKIVKSGSRPGMIFNLKYFSLNQDELLKAYEDAIGPEAAEALASMPDPVPPMDPNFPDKNYNPDRNKIDAARNRLTDGHPERQTEELRKLLEDAEKCLAVTNPDAREYVHMTYTGTYSSGNQSVNYESVLNNRYGNFTQQGFESLSDGRFKNKVRSRVRASDNTYAFEISDTDLLDGPITDEEQRILAEESRNKDTGLSKDTLDAVEKIEGEMNALDYLADRSALPMRFSDVQFYPNATGKEGVYGGEQGTKYYAFLPLHFARTDLVKALESGSEQDIRAGVQKYQQKYAHYRSMMETIHSDKLSQEPIASANVESTREEVDTLPGEFQLDYIGHHKLNSLFLNYGFAKNTGITMTELAADPYTAMMKTARNFAEANGPDAKTDSIGASLALSMRDYGGNMEACITGGWRASMEGGMGRGVLGIAGLEKNSEKRAAFLARANLATLSATKHVEDTLIKRTEILERVLTGKAEDSYAKRQAIYRNAALRPEKGEQAFSMTKIVDEFAKTGAQAEDWKTALDTEFFANGSSLYLDLHELAGRNRKILENFREEQVRSSTYASHFDPDEYLLTAFQQQSRLLEHARNRPELQYGYAEFRESVLKTYELAKNPKIRATLRLGAALIENKELLELLKTDKRDQIKTSDSGEYRRMHRDLNQIRDALSALKSGELKAMRKLKGFDMPEALARAKASAFDYYRLKLKNGTKDTFWYESGAKRAEEGKRVFQTLQQLQKEYGLLSPAQERYENARMMLLEHRNDPSWPQVDRERTLCELIYAKGVLDAGIPAEDQGPYLEAGLMERRFTQIRTSLLNKFKERDALGDLVGEAIEGNAQFQRRIAALGTSLKNSYDKKTAPGKMEAAKQAFCRGYALTLAAKELGLRSNLPAYCPQNPDVAERADEILKRPLFREVMERLMEGKDLAAIRKNGSRSMENNSGDRESEYDKAYQTVRYEKKCAALAADSLFKLQNKEPSPETRRKFEETLYRNREFRQACGALLGDDSGENIGTKIEDLDKPEIRNQTVAQLSEIAGRTAQKAQNAERILQEPRIENVPLIKEEVPIGKDSDFKKLPLIKEDDVEDDRLSLNDGGKRNNGGRTHRFPELFDPEDGKERRQEDPDDIIVYDKDGNVVIAPEEKGPKKGFIQSIIEDVNSNPNRRERPKEVGFGKN